MIVVSDSSPIIALSRINQLHILNTLYGEISIPEAVWQELTRADASQESISLIKNLDWIQVQSTSKQDLVISLTSYLDRGEAEAIALAAELNADLLLIDERKGRLSAKNLGLSIIGLLGVLVEAKHKGIVSELKPILDQLLIEAGFRLNKSLVERVLQEVGESDA